MTNELTALMLRYVWVKFIFERKPEFP